MKNFNKSRFEHICNLLANRITDWKMSSIQDEVADQWDWLVDYRKMDDYSVCYEICKQFGYQY